jgi:hypothetical protein
VGVLAEKLATAIERLDGVREDVRDMREEMKSLHKDVASLKATREVGKGWIGGASGVIALVISILGFFLGGCAAIDPVPDCNPPSRWGTPPVVVLDPRLPEACRASAVAALDFWAANGKRLTVETQGEDWLGFHEFPIPGRIAVGYSVEGRAPDANGSTLKVHWGDVDGPLRYAHIELNECNVLVAAHELGHALGLGGCLEPLGHSSAVHNLMFPVGPIGQELTTEQREWVK